MVILMAETLRYVEGLLANFPDNSQGLIKPVNMRDFVASFINGRGFLVDETPVNIPITDGVFTSVNPLLLSPIKSTTGLWIFDGNNLGVQNYNAIPDVIIPAAYQKLLSLVTVLDVSKAAGGADNYLMQHTKNGLPLGLAESVQFTAAGTQTVTLLATDFVDLSLADTFGVAIAGDGTIDDLTLNYFTMNLSDSILLAAP